MAPPSSLGCSPESFAEFSDDIGEMLSPPGESVVVENAPSCIEVSKGVFPNLIRTRISSVVNRKNMMMMLMVLLLLLFPACGAFRFDTGVIEDLHAYGFDYVKAKIDNGGYDRRANLNVQAHNQDVESNSSDPDLSFYNKAKGAPCLKKTHQDVPGFGAHTYYASSYPIWISRGAKGRSFDAFIWKKSGGQGIVQQVKNTGGEDVCVFFGVCHRNWYDSEPLPVAHEPQKIDLKDCKNDREVDSICSARMKEEEKRPEGVQYKKCLMIKSNREHARGRAAHYNEEQAKTQEAQRSAEKADALWRQAKQRQRVANMISMSVDPTTALNNNWIKLATSVSPCLSATAQSLLHCTHQYCSPVRRRRAPVRISMRRSVRPARPPARKWSSKIQLKSTVVNSTTVKKNIHETAADVTANSTNGQGHWMNDNYPSYCGKDFELKKDINYCCKSQVVVDFIFGRHGTFSDILGGLNSLNTLYHGPTCSACYADCTEAKFCDDAFHKAKVADARTKKLDDVKRKILEWTKKFEDLDSEFEKELCGKVIPSYQAFKNHFTSTCQAGFYKESCAKKCHESSSTDAAIIEGVNPDDFMKVGLSPLLDVKTWLTTTLQDVEQHQSPRYSQKVVARGHFSKEDWGLTWNHWKSDWHYYCLVLESSDQVHPATLYQYGKDHSRQLLGWDKDPCTDKLYQDEVVQKDRWLSVLWGFDYVEEWDGHDVNYKHCMTIHATENVVMCSKEEDNYKLFVELLKKTPHMKKPTP